MSTTSLAASPRKAVGKQPVSVVGLTLPAILLLLIVTFSVVNPTFYDPGNVLNILRSASISMVMFLGVTWVMAAGLTELSFMEIAAFSGMLFAYLLQKNTGVPVAAGLALALGTSIGAINGLLVGVLGFPALITTVAVAGFARSSGIALGSGQPIYVNASGFIGTLVNGTLGGIPIVILLAVVLYGFALLVQERLVFGHYLFAMEQNRTALAESGVPVRLIGFILFTFTGLVAAMAGLMLTASLSSGQPMIGNSFFLDGLTSVLLGAMVVRIGQPNVLGTVVGVLILAVLVNGLSLIGWPAYAREMIKGVLLLVGVGVVILSRNTGAARRAALS